jgi:hypothetical protein
MAEIYVNTNSPIKHKVYWRGELYEPTSNPTVKVYDITEDPAIIPPISPTQLLVTLTSEKLDNDKASYVVYLPLSIASRYKELQLVWEYTISGENVQKKHKVFIRVPYTDITQATDALGLGTDPSDPNYKTYFELAEAERWARKVIENYTGQSFYTYNDVHIVYPTGSDVLPLPYKLSELHELYQNDILLVDTINNIDNWNYPVQISESGFALRVNRANLLDNTVYTANGMVPPTINDTYGGAFANGSVYRVQGKFGWDNVPDEVELACIELMKDYFSYDKSWRNKYLHSVQTFDWHFEYNEESFRGTGNVYADQVLLPYVLTQMVVI